MEKALAFRREVDRCAATQRCRQHQEDAITTVMEVINRAGPANHDVETKAGAT
jgi:hypothetical protein